MIGVEGLSPLEAKVVAISGKNQHLVWCQNNKVMLLFLFS
jgi:hypothetical protein